MRPTSSPGSPDQPEGNPPPALPVGEPRRHASRRPQVLALGGAMLVVLVAGLVRPWEKPDETRLEVKRLLNQARRAERNQQGFYAFLEQFQSWPKPIPKLIEWIRGDNASSYDVEDALVDLGERAGPHLLQELQTDRSPAVRGLCVAVLGNLANPNYLLAITNALLSDRADEVRSRAASAAANLESVRVSPALLQALRFDTNAGVRSSAASALSSGDPDLTVPPLLTALERESDANVRATVIRALGELGDLRAAPGLRRALADSDLSLRASAAEALGSLGDQEAVPALIELVALRLSQLETNNAGSAAPETSWRNSHFTFDPVIRALGRLGDPQAVGPLAQVLDASLHPEGTGRGPLLPDASVVIEALGSIGGAAALAALRAAVGVHTNFTAQIMEAIGEVGDPAAANFLLDLAENEQQALQRGGQPERRATLTALLRALGNCEAHQAVHLLIECVDERQPREVRDAAVESLGLLGDSVALPALASALKFRDEETRQEAAWSLGYLGDPAALASLTQALQDRSFQVRFAAAFSLAILRRPESIPALGSLLNDKEPRGRLAGACSLAFHGSAGGLDQLVRAVRAREPWERFAAAAALLRLHSPAALEAVRPLRQDPKPPVRQFAVTGLEQGLSAALLQTLRDPSEDFRHYAVRLLAFQQDLTALPALREAARDPRPTVRRAARITMTVLQRTSQGPQPP